MSDLSENKTFQQSGKHVFLLFICCFLNFIPGLMAQDLLLFPKRIEFEGTQNRVQTVNLTNIGQDTTTFKISYTEARMTPEGKIETITEPDPGQRFAEPFLRVFPRTVTIAPNKSQLVKIQLTRTSDLEPGEYRSHLYFRPIPKVEAKEELTAPVEEGQLKIEITPIYGYAIANIIKVGEPTTQVEISEVELIQTAGNSPVLQMNFHRSGNMSSYGDVRVLHISPDGKETEVAISNGFGIYSPGYLRKASFPLKAIEGVDYSSGSLRILYSSSGTGKEVIAETYYNL